MCKGGGEIEKCAWCGKGIEVKERIPVGVYRRENGEYVHTKCYTPKIFWEKEFYIKKKEKE